MIGTLVRSTIAFIVAPLAGAAVFCFLLIAFDLPHDAARAPGYILFMFFPLASIFIAIPSLLVGIPAYLILRKRGPIRASQFAVLFGAVGTLGWGGLAWSAIARKPEVLSLVLVAGITGAVTGAVLGRMLQPAHQGE